MITITDYDFSLIWLFSPWTIITAFYDFNYAKSKYSLRKILPDTIFRKNHCIRQKISVFSYSWGMYKSPLCGAYGSTNHSRVASLSIVSLYLSKGGHDWSNRYFCQTSLVRAVDISIEMGWAFYRGKIKYVNCELYHIYINCLLLTNVIHRFLFKKQNKKNNLPLRVGKNHSKSSFFREKKNCNFYE